ncbi:MAG: type IV pilus biogenesis/stability protein PilW [Rhodocyclaceae bacterium]|nr:type IV pilus biogenesis/stability protein PilW [Rhodocyclaceae bacterium]
MMVWLLAAGSLSACVTTPSVQDAPRVPAVQAISQQAAQSDERQRAKTHTELGALYAQDGRFAVALEEARIALNADSSYAPAYSLQGLVHMFLGDKAQAEEAFRNALSIAPNDPETNNNYGWFLCQTGREAESIPRFKAVYRNQLYLTPTKPYTNAGICLLRMKDYAAAEEHLNTALRYQPGNSQAHYWLAELYYQTNRLNDARMRVNELSRMIEPSVEVTWLGARIERKQGDREAELRYTTIMRRKFQDTAQYQKMLQGQFE